MAAPLHRCLPLGGRGPPLIFKNGLVVYAVWLITYRSGFVCADQPLALEARPGRIFGVRGIDDSTLWSRAMTTFQDIINNRYKSDRTDLELESCCICDRPLSLQDLYFIAKAYHGGRCIMEAVQCFQCQMESRNYASEQSMENITLYSGRRFNEFLQDGIQRKLYHLEEPSCLITGEHLALKDSFELYCFNIPGSGLDEDNFLFVGPTAMEQMTELLSEETRKSWGRYSESFSPDAPEIVVSPIFMG